MASGFDFSVHFKAIDDVSTILSKLKKNFSEVEKVVKEVSTSFQGLNTNLSKVDRANKKVSTSFQSLNANMVGVEKASNSFSGLDVNLLKANKTIKETTESMKKLSDKIKHTQKEAGESSGKMVENVSTHFEKLRNKMSRTREDIMNIGSSFVTVGAMVAVPVKAAIEFESSMADVKKVLDFSNEGEFKKLGNDFLEMSTRIPISAKGLSEIASAGGSLGIATKDIKLFTESVAKMSTAFDMSTTDAGEAMGKIMNIYHLGIKKANNLGDTINALDAGMATNARNIVNAMTRVGASADIFGLTADQTAGLTAAFLSVGQPVEVVGTSIENMLNKLGLASEQDKKFQEAMKSMGMSSLQLKKDIKTNASGAISHFLHTLKGMDKSKQQSILFNMFGQGISGNIAALVNGVDQYDKSVGIVSDTVKNAGSMEREFGIRSKTTANQIELMKNRINAMSIKIGDMLLPILQEILKKLTPVFRAMKVWIDNNKQVVKYIFAIIGAIFALMGIVLIAKVFMLAYAGGMMIVAGALFAMKTAITVVTATMKLLNLVLTLNPIGLVISAITAVIAIFIYWDEIVTMAKEGLASFFTWLEGKLPWMKGAIDMVKSVASAIGLGEDTKITQNATIKHMTTPLDHTIKAQSNVNVNLQAQGMRVASVTQQTSGGSNLNVGVNSLGVR